MAKKGHNGSVWLSLYLEPWSDPELRCFVRAADQAPIGRFCHWFLSARERQVRHSISQPLQHLHWKLSPGLSTNFPDGLHHAELSRGDENPPLRTTPRSGHFWILEGLPISSQWSPDCHNIRSVTFFHYFVSGYDPEAPKSLFPSWCSVQSCWAALLQSTASLHPFPPPIFAASTHPCLACVLSHRLQPSRCVTDPWLHLYFQFFLFGVSVH